MGCYIKVYYALLYTYSCGKKEMLDQSETQAVSSRIWTLVTNSFSNDDNLFAVYNLYILSNFC